MTGYAHIETLSCDCQIAYAPSNGFESDSKLERVATMKCTEHAQSDPWTN